MKEAAARELIAWWRGVAADEQEGVTTWSKVGNLGRSRESAARGVVWARCADQLELALAGKPFNPDP